MTFFNRAINFCLALAVAALVLNDVARWVFPSLQQTVVQSVLENTCQDENNSVTSTLLEEEVKHKTPPIRHNALSF